MSEHDKQDKPSKLAADLILGPDGELETELAAAHDPFAEVPLDPSAFVVPDAATQRIDVARANDPHESVEAPRTGGSAAAFDHLFTDLPQDAPTAPDPRSIGKASGEAPLPPSRDRPAQTGVVAQGPAPVAPMPPTDMPFAMSDESVPASPLVSPEIAAAAETLPRGTLDLAEPATPDPAAPRRLSLPPVPSAPPTSPAAAPPTTPAAAPLTIPPAALPTTAPPAPQTKARSRPTPLPTGLADPDGIPHHGIQAIPIEASHAKAPRKVQLPCNLLVAAPELAPAAQTAAKLMEHGYTCRVIGAEGRENILSEQSFDAAVVELTIAEAQRDSGRHRLLELAKFYGPVVVISPIELPEILDAPVHIARVLVRPIEVDALIDAIEDERSSASPNSIDTPMPAAAGDLFDLGVNMVRAQINVGDLTTRGRVRSMSYGGEMVVDMKEALPLGTKITVRLRTVNDRETELSGKVVGIVGTLSTMRTKVTDIEAPVVTQFVDEARDVTQASIHQVVMRAFVTGSATVAPVGTAALAEHWTRVRNSIDDDDAQQAFIKSCLEAKQIEFAVKCYRELKEQDPEDERVQRYLNQVGTILGFYAFKKNAAKAVDTGSVISTPMKVALGLFVLAAVVLWVLVEILA